MVLRLSLVRQWFNYWSSSISGQKLCSQKGLVALLQEYAQMVCIAITKLLLYCLLKVQAACVKSNFYPEEWANHAVLRQWSQAFQIIRYLWSDAQREGGAVQVCVMPYCCTEVHASSVALKSPTVSLEIQTKAGYTIQAFSLHSTWCACYYDAFLSKVPNPMIHKAAVIIQLVVIELTFVMYHLTYPL